jgi:hypothetical protein
MNANSASHTLPVPLRFTRRDELLARRRVVAGGAVEITPRTTCLVVRADPFTAVGEQVRRSIQEVREDGARVVFRNGAYRLRESQAAVVSGHLRESPDSAVRSAGRVMVGQPAHTVLVATVADPQVLDQGLAAADVDTASPAILER